MNKQLAHKESSERIRIPSGVAGIILTVIVSRGKPPAPILVRCFKDDKYFLDITSPYSFDHHFTRLGEGDYDIYIIGFNQKDGGDTTCFLTGDEINVIPADKTTIKCEEAAYLAAFHFTVGE